MASDLFCLSYTTAIPWSVWPRRAYPIALGPFLSGGALADTQRAWNFYEQVEAYDAQQRQTTAPQWFPLSSTSEWTLYRRGQVLHASICPSLNWRSQRFLGLVAPGSNILPQPC